MPLPRQLASRYDRPTTQIGSPCNTCEIREISVCGVLDPEEIERLRAIISTVHCEQGQVIIHEGDPAEHLFNVVSGAVRLYKLLPDGRRQITGFLMPGDFLGIALNESYAYTAEALNLVHLCRFPRRRLEVLLHELPALERSLLGEASSELVAAQDQMLLLGRKTARERVASFLVMLSERAARHGRPANPIELPMIRADIADFLGLTTETVSRTFSHLKRNGIIDLAIRGQVEIKRRHALEALREAG